MEEYKVKKNKGVTVWVDYASEGWKPYYYISLDALAKELLVFNTPFNSGCQIKITEEVEIQFSKKLKS